MPPPAVLAPLAQQWPTLRAAYPGLTWVAPERWHITLAFLGDLRSGQRHRLEEQLAEATGALQPFRLRVEGAGAFPAERRARVLWVGLGGDTTALAELAAQVRRAAGDARIPLDGKRFRAHITAARARRDVAAHDVPHLLRKLSVAEGAGWDVERFVLMASTLGPRPRYDELAGWSFADHQA